MTGGPQYMRAGKIARLLGMTERTVRRWIASGELPSVKIGGARLVSREDLEALLGQSGASDDEDEDGDEDDDEDEESERMQYQVFIFVSGKLCQNNRSIYFVIVFPNVTVCHGF